MATTTTTKQEQTADYSDAADCSTPQIPMMKCVQASEYGDEHVLSIGEQAQPIWKPGSNKLLIRVDAVSLSPSDYRMLSGDTDVIKKPPSFPYIPGGDVCGIVEESDNDNFKKGDSVIATWYMFGIGGLAEYALVDVSLTAHKPDSVSACDGAALANSASHALCAVRNANIGPGSRVLVLGGSGGVGSIIVQMAKNAGASFIAATSTNTELVTSLGADHVINYHADKWWFDEKIRSEPLDVVFDCAEGCTAWQRARAEGLLKPGGQGGKWIAVIPQKWRIEMHSYMGVAMWFVPVLGRYIWTRAFKRWTPTWIMSTADANGETIAEVCSLVDKGKLKVVCDPTGPFPFTEEGVRDAFKLHTSRHAKGKVVIQVHQPEREESEWGFKVE